MSAEDTTAESEAVLHELEFNWGELWPEMLNLLKDGMEHLDIELELADQEIVGCASRTRVGKFMSDKSDVHLTFSYGELPDWGRTDRRTTIPESSALSGSASNDRSSVPFSPTL